ncbi:hypothetical protein [Rhizohabitans arisaemae]|uniref:hypothetical protein n=1 Tax=Rhizohabitans arisaemae TaxID=2720610 RepID=UPI0024B09AC2|nr:hypothetical protein [Rhizohabitans arisaemae]
MKRALASTFLVLGWVLMLAGVATPAGAETTGLPVGRVALIGVSGLSWSDLDAANTPNLWRLTGESALGSMSVRTVGTVTCPYDAWLTVSAGSRSAVGYRCGAPPTPQPQGTGAVIPDFDWLTEMAEQKYTGTLGTAARAAGKCTTAIGPGAALALADRAGRVDVYAPTPTALDTAAWSRCDLIAVDVDVLVAPYLKKDGHLSRESAEPIPAAERAALVRQADTVVGEALARIPADATLLVAGVSDHASVPHLRVGMWRTAGAAGHHLGSASTHRDDMVILPDITATMLATAGIATPDSVVGVPWEIGRAADRDTAVTVLKGADVAGQTIRALGAAFFTTLAVLQVVFYLLAYLLLRRRRSRPLIRIAGLALASLPAATYLANLIPWWRFPAPLAGLIGGILGFAALTCLLALAGPWRRHLLGPPTVVAAVTAAVLGGDLLTGTTLQLNSVMGFNGVNGARYYGLGNIPFALFATSVLLVSAAIGQALINRGRRLAAVAVILVLGTSAMILGGWPGVGSDFGGVIAFVPGIAVAALLIAGQRVSLAKLGVACVGGGVTVMAIAYLDYLRPAASQTHLGRFFGQVLTGEALPVITRKLAAMLGTLLNPNLMPIVIAAIAFLVFAVVRPGAATAGALPALFERAPVVKAGFIGALISGVLGTLVNDSGIAVLSMALALAVPLTLAAGVLALQHQDSPTGTTPPLPTEPATT